jgi:hypothetical protein
MPQLQNITFHFPANNHRQTQAFNYLAYLLTASPTTVASETGVELGIEPSLHTLPRISFKPSMEVTPQVTFDKLHTVILNKTPEQIKAGRKELSLEEINLKFAQHITSVDHVGINVQKITEEANDRDALLYYLGSTAHTYGYPTGEPWYFLFPSTKNEYKGAITDFSRARNPKFELVLDAEYPGTLLQFDFATNLSRAEVEALLPAPYGIGLPGLSEYFRSVYATNPWNGLEIRFDFRYKTEAVNDWSTGKWLITEGKRVK